VRIPSSSRSFFLLLLCEADFPLVPVLRAVLVCAGVRI
jgi:hypothetical protein